MQSTVVPNQKPYMRGMMRLYGEAVPLMDMRKRLGLRSLQSDVTEFVEMMEARERDHINWLNALQKSVDERVPFSLSRDHKGCAFGKWYYQFVPNLRQNSTLRLILEQFDEPLARIHAVAEQVLRLSEHGDKEGALALIAEKKQRELKKMIRLFARVKDEYKIRHREVAVVLAGDAEQLFGLIVDEVSEIVSLSPADVHPMDAVMSGYQDAPFVSGVAEIVGTGATFLTIDVARL